VNVQPKAPRATKIAKMDRQTYRMGGLWDADDPEVKGFLGDFSWGNAGGMRTKRRLCAGSSAAGMAFRRSASRARGKKRVGGWAGSPARPGRAVRALGEHRGRALGEPLGEPWASGAGLPVAAQQQYSHAKHALDGRAATTHRSRSDHTSVAQRPL